MNKKRSAAQKFGKFFAHIQSSLDDLSAWGFSHLKKAGESSEEEEITDDSVATKIKKGAKKTAHFFGEMGESFYKEYEKLKKKKSS